MPTIALFYPRIACLLFIRLALCAINTGLASNYVLQSKLQVYDLAYNNYIVIGFWERDEICHVCR